MFAPYSRDQLRQAYVDAWRRRAAELPLTPLDSMLCDVIELHAEYHSVVDAAAAASESPAADVHGAAENPFLHMGLHVAVREQLAIDRPPGVVDLRRLLAARLGNPHDAEHALMDALAETLWEAQSKGTAPDASTYLARARRRIADGG